MPIKVRCESCGKGLNAPDKLRGKTVKCPNCSEPLRVPSGKKRSDAPRKKRPPQPSAPAAMDDDFLAGMDLRQAEDRNTRICPRCATEVDEEDIDCPNCGVDLATGTMTAAKRKRMRRKGPDPEDFYGKLFPDCWKFVKKNWQLGIKSAFVLAVLLSLTMCAGRAAEWNFVEYLNYVNEEVAGNNNVTVQGGFTMIDASKNQPTRFLDKFYTSPARLATPLVMTQTRPPYMFWTFVSAICSLASSGWLLFLALAITRATMEKKTKIGKLDGDFFSNIALGIRSAIWFPFVWYPFLAIFGGAAFGGMGQQSAAIATGGFSGLLGLVSLFFLPVAIVHMTQRYTYKAYLLVPLIRLTLKNFGAIGFWVLSYFAMNFLWLGIFGAIGATFMSQIKPRYTNMMDNQIIGWLQSNVAGFGQFFTFSFYELPVLFLMGLVINFFIGLLIAFGSLYVSRGIGLFGYYNQENLELENEQTALEPVGFGPRYIAAITDSFMYILTFFIVKNRNANLILGLLLLVIIVNCVPMFQTPATAILLPAIIGLFILANAWIYFAFLESSYEQCTVGKNAVGIIVVDAETKQRITMQQGNRRFIGKIINGLTLGIGYAMAAFNPGHFALHDRIAKTQVVWRGEEATSNL